MLHGIDPGGSLGWATWGSGDRPHVRLLDLKTESEGAGYARLRTYAREVISPGDHVAIEGMILVDNASISSRLRLFGLRAIIVMATHERGARLHEFPASTWRSRFMGVTQAPAIIKGAEPRRRWIKGKAVVACQQQGWGTVSEDEAEALGILHCLRCSLDSVYADRGTLFAR